MNHFWKNIYGHARLKEVLLKIAFSEKEPNVFLFVGPEGVGKFAIALRYAQISSIGRVSEKEFFENPIFKRIANLAEPRIKLALPSPPSTEAGEDNSTKKKLSTSEIACLEEINLKKNNPYASLDSSSSKTIRIDTIREIINFVSYKYDEVNKRFIIIPNADMMNMEAQNSLLKTLEEPPEDVFFILLTSKPNQLLETIKSRCRIFYFGTLGKEDIARILEEYFGINKNRSMILASFSDGSISEAEKLLKKDIDDFKQKCVNFLRNVFVSKYYSAYKILNFNFGSQQEKEDFKFFLKILQFWFNSVQKNLYELDDEKFKSEKEIFIKFNQKYKNFNYTKAVYLLDKYLSVLDRNANPNVVLNNLVLELSALKS